MKGKSKLPRPSRERAGVRVKTFLKVRILKEGENAHQNTGGHLGGVIEKGVPLRCLIGKGGF